MEKIELKPIGGVKNEHKELVDSNWEQIISEIELVEGIPTKSL